MFLFTVADFRHDTHTNVWVRVFEGGESAELKGEAKQPRCGPFMSRLLLEVDVTTTTAVCFGVMSSSSCCCAPPLHIIYGTAYCVTLTLEIARHTVACRNFLSLKEAVGAESRHVRSSQVKWKNDQTSQTRNLR